MTALLPALAIHTPASRTVWLQAKLALRFCPLTLVLIGYPAVKQALIIKSDCVIKLGFLWHQMICLATLFT